MMRKIFDSIFDPNATPDQRATPYHPRTDDTIVAGSGKSGTTWLAHILHQIRVKGDDTFSDIASVTFQIPLYNQKFDYDLDRDQPGDKGRIFKCHDLYDNIPKIGDKTRFVVVVRDPYDRYYSLIKFLCRCFDEDRDMTVDDYRALYLDPDSKSPDYCAWFMSWWPHRKDPNVLWLHYENLQRDLESYIDKIAQFYINNKLEVDIKEKILRQCSHDYMSQRQEKFTGAGMVKMIARSGNVDKPDRVWKGQSVVRKDGGRVGQGGALLDDKVKKFLDDRWAETMGQKFGIISYKEILEGRYQ